LVKNWKELAETVGQDEAFAASNIAFTDPNFEEYSLSTRLRFFDDSGKPVKLDIDIEFNGIPKGYEFSLYSRDPALSMERAILSERYSIGMSVEVEDNYDVPVTLQIQNTGGTPIPEDASISIIAHVSEEREQDGRKQFFRHVLGGEHIIFRSNSSQDRESNGMRKSRRESHIPRPTSPPKRKSQRSRHELKARPNSMRQLSWTTRPIWALADVQAPYGNLEEDYDFDFDYPRTESPGAVEPDSSLYTREQLPPDHFLFYDETLEEDHPLGYKYPTFWRLPPASPAFFVLANPPRDKGPTPPSFYTRDPESRSSSWNQG